MIDFLFMEFYIQKKYNIKVETYFNITKHSVSLWRTSNHIPSNRLLEFFNKDKTLDVTDLFNLIYKNS